MSLSPSISKDGAQALMDLVVLRAEWKKHNLHASNYRDPFGFVDTPRVQRILNGKERDGR